MLIITRFVWWNVVVWHVFVAPYTVDGFVYEEMRLSPGNCSEPLSVLRYCRSEAEFEEGGIVTVGPIPQDDPALEELRDVAHEELIPWHYGTSVDRSGSATGKMYRLKLDESLSLECESLMTRAFIVKTGCMLAQFKEELYVHNHDTEALRAQFVKTTHYKSSSAEGEPCEEPPAEFLANDWNLANVTLLMELQGNNAHTGVATHHFIRFLEIRFLQNENCWGRYYEIVMERPKKQRSSFRGTGKSDKAREARKRSHGLALEETELRTALQRLLAEKAQGRQCLVAGSRRTGGFAPQCGAEGCLSRPAGDDEVEQDEDVLSEQESSSSAEGEPCEEPPAEFLARYRV